MRHSCWPSFQKRSFSLKAAYSKQKDRKRWHSWRARGPGANDVDCHMGNDEERPPWRRSGFRRSCPVLAGLIALAVPARRAAAASTISVVESGRSMLGVRSFTLRLLLRGLTRQPVSSQAFVVRLEFWLGLIVRYRLPQRHRIESPSIGLLRDLLLGPSLGLIICFSLSPSPLAHLQSFKLAFSQARWWPK